MDFSISLIVFLVILVLLVGYIIKTYNGLTTIRNHIEEAWGQIDVQLKRRHDLIPNLVEITKDMMDFEQETLSKVVEARGQAVSAGGGSRADAMQAENMLTQALGRFMAVVEAYPDLKSQEQVGKLTEELSSTENRISFARQYYNDNVVNLNTMVELFPSNFIARSFGFQRADYFDVEDNEREAVSVNLR